MELLPCALCGKELEEAYQGAAENNVPYAGTLFMSHGHYGSTAWDPVEFLASPDKPVLEIIICDSCLTMISQVQRVYKRTRIPPESADFQFNYWTSPLAGHENEGV